MKKWTIISICLVTAITVSSLFLTPAHAETRMPYEGMIEEFFARIQRNKPEAAAVLLWDKYDWVEKRHDTDTVRVELNALMEELGDCTDYVKLGSKTVGNRYTYIYYAAFYEKGIRSFIFEMYKPHNKWLIWNVRYNDELPDKVEEGVKKEIFGL